jgi:hypothetical protein
MRFDSKNFLKTLLRYFGRLFKSFLAMNSVSGNFYAAWRAHICASNFLHDEHFPTERLLQAVWQHQRLHRDALKTSGDKTVRILHPGFASVEGGPDFRQAVLQIGDDPPRAGDVEIDLRTSGWHAHGHDRNPNFQNVLLHVVWEAGIPTPSSPGNANPPERELQPPILSLKNVLDASLAELSLSLENESLRVVPEHSRGKCIASLRELSESQLLELLNSAARVRFENKAAQMRARAHDAGWEQALWENLFRALGYKHNAWPMQNLAEQRKEFSDGNLFELQARLFGISGLLPAEIVPPRRASHGVAAPQPRSNRQHDHYLRDLWDFWWRERDQFESTLLPRSLWKFHGLRPANHPQRRIALASHWLAEGKLVSRIEGWITNDFAGRSSPAANARGRGRGTAGPAARFFPESLREILRVDSDPFWSWHWTFRSARMKKPQPLLGAARVTDLAVNGILPWLWVRAKEGQEEQIQREVEQRFFAWPAGADNSILKLARQRLLGLDDAKLFKTAASQQGLLQIVRDFCEQSNAICQNCRFPELVATRKSP